MSDLTSYKLLFLASIHLAHLLQTVNTLNSNPSSFSPVFFFFFNYLLLIGGINVLSLAYQDVIKNCLVSTSTK